MNNIIEMISKRSGNKYNLMILKEKKKEEYRICNITKGHICPCIFNTHQEAIDDIIKYEEEGRIIIITEKESLGGIKNET